MVSSGSPSSVVGGFSINQLSVFLSWLQRAKAPSLHGHYPASTLLWASPTPPEAAGRLLVPARLRFGACAPSPPQEVSQVPGPPCADAPPSLPREVPPLRAI